MADPTFNGPTMKLGAFAGLNVNENRLEADVMTQLNRFTRAFVGRAATQARALAPVRTGHLKESTHADDVRVVGRMKLASGVSADAKYAAPVHEGARRHMIFPRNGQYLRFQISGRTIFARKVNHPGNKPNRFISNAVHRVASSDPRIKLGER